LGGWLELSSVAELLFEDFITGICRCQQFRPHRCSSGTPFLFVFTALGNHRGFGLLSNDLLLLSPEIILEKWWHLGSPRRLRRRLSCSVLRLHGLHE